MGEVQYSPFIFVQLDQTQLGMPSRDYFLKGRNEPRITAYQTYAIQVVEALGANPTTAQDEMTDMVDFEIKIANVCVRKNPQNLLT